MDLFTSEPNEKGRALPTWGDQSLVFCGQSPWAWGPLGAHVALCKHSFPTWFEGRVPFPTIVLLQDFITHDETFPKPSRKCFAQPDAFILQNIAQSKQEGRLIRCNGATAGQSKRMIIQAEDEGREEGTFDSLTQICLTV